MSPELPLAERILCRLGPNPWPWIALWAIVPLVRPFVQLLGAPGPGMDPAMRTTDLLVPQAVQSWAVVIALWGAPRIARRMQAVEHDLGHDSAPGTGRAIPMSSTAGPLSIVAVITSAELVIQLLHHGWLAALVDLPLMILNVLPMATFLWTYVALLAAMNRIGRSSLALDPFPQDRSLGLGPVGALGFTGFWLLVAAAVPVVVMSGREVGTFVLGIAIVVGSFVSLVASTWGVHRQMTTAKERYRADARRLYSEAYEPVRRRPTIAVLEAQANVLRAAQALDERAERIYEWPLDERTAARMAIVTTGIITGLIVRSVFVLLGY